MRTFGIDEPMGCYDDFEHADAFVLWGSNMAEMHPILWSRLTDRRLTAKHVKIAVLSTFSHRSTESADMELIFKPQHRSGTPQLHLQLHHLDRRVNAEFVREARHFREGRRPISVTGCARRTRARGTPVPGAAEPRRPDAALDFESFAASCRSTRWRRCRGCRAWTRTSWSRSRSCTPTRNGRSCRMDDGVQPAHARRVGEQDDATICIC